MLKSFRFALLALAALLAGCSFVQGFTLKPYRMNIQQGNFLEAKDVDQLELGMSRSQVKFLIGTPMVADPFNAERWDYVFYFQPGRTQKEISNRLTIWFEDDKIARIDRPKEFQKAPEPSSTDFDTDIDPDIETAPDRTTELEPVPDFEA